MFESISGFTTTGATVLRPIEGNGPGIMMWRALTQWMGGMGVIVLVVAVLPTVGSGGMSLLEAEAPGPTGERLTPRVRHTARRLWGVYLGFTIVLALAYIAAGMSSVRRRRPQLHHRVDRRVLAVQRIARSLRLRQRSSGSRSSRCSSPAPASRCCTGSSEGRRGRSCVRRSSTSTPCSWSTVSAVMFFVNDATGSVADRIRGAFVRHATITSTTGYATDDFAAWSARRAGDHHHPVADRSDGRARRPAA